MFQILRDAQPEAEIGCIYEWDGIKYVVDTLSTSYQEMVHPSKIYTDEMKNMSVKYIKKTVSSSLQPTMVESIMAMEERHWKKWKPRSSSPERA